MDCTSTLPTVSPRTRMRTTRDSPGASGPSTQRQLSDSSGAQLELPASSDSRTAALDPMLIQTATSPVAWVPSERTTNGISYTPPTARSTLAGPAVISTSRSACTHALALALLLAVSLSAGALTLAAANKGPASVVSVLTVSLTLAPGASSATLQITENWFVLHEAPGMLAEVTGWLRFSDSTA